MGGAKVSLEPGGSPLSLGQNPHAKVAHSVGEDGCS